MLGLSKRPKSGYLYQTVVAASCTHLEVALWWSLVFNSIEKLIFPSLLDEFGWIRARVGYSFGTTVAITEYFSIDSSALNRLKVPNRKDSRWRRRRRRRLRRRKGVVCEAVYNVSDINTLRCPGSSCYHIIFSNSAQISEPNSRYLYLSHNSLLFS